MSKLPRAGKLGRRLSAPVHAESRGTLNSLPPHSEKRPFIVANDPQGGSSHENFPAVAATPTRRSDQRASAPYDQSSGSGKSPVVSMG
jgi:hypothetical protein